MTFFTARRSALAFALSTTALCTAAVAVASAQDMTGGGGVTATAGKAGAAASAQLLCAPGKSAAEQDGLAWYDTGRGLTLMPVEAGQPCALLATGAGLNVQFPGQGAILLAGPVNYQLGSTPRSVELALAEPALCESYYTGTDQLALQLTDTNATVQTLRGVRRVDYTPGTARFTTEVVAGNHGPMVQCYSFPFSSLTANPPSVPAPPPVNPALIFGSGFDDTANLVVELLTANGSTAIRQLDVSRDQPFQYQIRITNRGAVTANGVRVREFVPLPATQPLLSPVVSAGAWTCTTAAGPCSGVSSGNGPLNQAGLSIGPGQSRTYTLTRTVASGTPTQRTLLGAAVFFDPQDASGAGDRNPADNSAPLVLNLVSNQGPQIACTGLASPVDFDENAQPREFPCSLSDPEGDQIASFTVQSNSNPSLIPSTGMLTPAAGPDSWTLRFAPAANLLGTANVVLRATDDRGGLRDLTVVVNVNDINSPPSFSLLSDELRLSPTGGLPRDATGNPIDTPNVVRGSNCPSQDVCSLTFPDFLRERSVGLPPESPGQQLQASVSCAPHSIGLNPFEIAPSITPSTPQAVSQPFALTFTYRKSNFDPAPNPAVEVICTVTVVDTGSPPLSTQRTVRIVYNN